MKQKFRQLLTAICVLLFTTSLCWSQEQAPTSKSVPTYPQATFNNELTQISKDIQEKLRATRPELSQGMIMSEAQFYLSDDPFDKVVDYYKDSFGIEEIKSIQELFAEGNLPDQSKTIAFKVNAPLKQQAMVYKMTMGLDVDPEKFDGTSRSVFFAKGMKPELQVQDGFIHPKTFEVIDKTIIILIKNKEK
jgi:hypothetical protein